MAMPLPRVPTTADEIDAMPDDGNRYELIHGKLFVTPAPSIFHQRMLLVLLDRLRPYAISLGLEVFVAPTAVRSSLDTQVEPDLFVLPRMVEADESTRWVAMPRLLLAVEILSPSTRRRDRVVKRELYLPNGVAEYWIVDSSTQSIDVCTLSDAMPVSVSDMLSWQPRAESNELMIDVAAVFREVRGSA